VLGDDALRRRVEVPRAAVIPEALPQPQHVLLVCGSQAFDRGKTSDKTLEIRDDGGDLRLLEHRLADEHAIRVQGFTRAALQPPWKLALVRVVPAQQPPGECRVRSDHVRVAFMRIVWEQIFCCRRLKVAEARVS
jgi:hypothetical protein